MLKDVEMSKMLEDGKWYLIKGRQRSGDEIMNSLVDWIGVGLRGSSKTNSGKQRTFDRGSFDRAVDRVLRKWLPNWEEIEKWWFDSTLDK